MLNQLCTKGSSARSFVADLFVKASICRELSALRTSLLLQLSNKMGGGIDGDGIIVRCSAYAKCVQDLSFEEWEEVPEKWVELGNELSRVLKLCKADLSEGEIRNVIKANANGLCEKVVAALSDS